MKDSEKIPAQKGPGGARPGAGRPKGTVDRVTIEGLLQAVQTRANGRPYVELLAEDFIEARNTDRQLAAKYHNLILNKVAATLNQVEVKDSADTVEAKQQAFIEAVARLTGDSSTK